MCGHSPKAMGQNPIRVLDGIGCNADIVSSLHSCHVAAEPSARHLGLGFPVRSHEENGDDQLEVP